MSSSRAGEQVSQVTPSDRILTVPNLLTSLRLLIVPVFLWSGLVLEDMLLTTALGVASTFTDLADGFIARRWGQITKLGMRLDPLSDRLSLAAAIVVILVHSLAPALLVLSVVARDILLVAIGVPILKATGRPIPEVTILGKRSSFGVSLGMGLFFFAAAIGSIEQPSDPWRWAGIAVLAVSVPAYLVSGVDYVRRGLTGSSARQAG